jgi:flagellar basal-body rod protein FlgC
MIGAISTALSGLMAASKRADASASNIANMHSAGSLDKDSAKQPYSAVTTVQTSHGDTGGVSATNIPKQPGYVPAYAPGSPHADAKGMIGAPNVDLAEEAVNLKLAEISYKASIKALQVAQDMAKETTRIFDKKA